MEDGTITLVGATTENPSFELNGALLSRALVLVFHRLDEAALEELLARAEQEEGRPLPLDAEARETLIAMADGDGRTVLNMAEEVFGAVRRGRAAARPRRPHRAGAAPRAALRQVARRPLQPDQRAAQVGARLRSGRRRSTGWRACSTAARTACTSPAAWCAWRSRTSASPTRRRVVQALAAKDVVRFPGLARGRAGAGAGHRLSRHRAQIECRLHGLRRGHARGQGARQPGAAQAHPQRADQADEAGGLRRGLRLRPQRAGGLLRPELLPRRDGAPAVLRPDGRGFEAEIKKRLEHWAKLRAKRGS